MANWSIQKLGCFPNYNNTENVVHTLLWNVSASRVVGENTFTTSQSSTVDVAISDGPYIPFSELTEQNVLDWLFDALGNSKLTIEASLELELDRLQTPQESIPTPPLSTLTPPWG